MEKHSVRVYQFQFLSGYSWLSSHQLLKFQALWTDILVYFCVFALSA